MGHNPSPTGAVGDIYENFEMQLNEYCNAISPQEGECGALFAISGLVIGLDLFDNPKALEGLLPKLVKSYALDAIEKKKSTATVNTKSTETFLEKVMSANIRNFPAVGLGEDIRIVDEEQASGAALMVDEKNIHLCAFQNHRAGEGERHESRSNQPRMARASQRRERQ